MLLRYFLSVVLFFVAYPTYAYLPVMTENETVHTVTEITDFKTEHMYFGELTGFPHMYLLRSGEPFTLKVMLLLPDTQKVTHDINSIIIRETGFQGRIEEVTRLLAKDALWESSYDPWGGDWYQEGVTYEETAEAGVYRIEVSSPNNTGKYVLVLGHESALGSLGYFELVGRLSEVKSFLGKSQVRMLEAPLVFIPLVIVISIGVILRRRRRATSRE